jgi:hypothetical protein
MVTTLLLMLAMGGVPWATGGQAQDARYEHRVVVATTSWDREEDVDGSLERHVNALAARGFEVAALVGGGDAAIPRSQTPSLRRRGPRRPHLRGDGAGRRRRARGA